MNRQLVGAVNIYLRFKGLKPRPETFMELTRNIGDRPNIVIDIRPREQTVQNILKKYQRLLADSNKVKSPSPLDVGSFPTIHDLYGGVGSPRMGRRPMKRPR